MNLGRAATIALLASPLAIGAFVARMFAKTAPARLGSDFAQPMVVAGAWGTYGGEAFAILAGAVAACALPYAFALHAMARHPSPVDRPAIVVGAVVGLVGAACWPFVFSSDAYAYAAYGDLAERGFDSHRLVPAGVHDAFIDAARRQWAGPFPVDVYGPAMLAIARAAVRFTGGWGVAATLGTLRLAASVAFLASVVVLDRALVGFERGGRSAALGAYALNPVLLWSAAEGHNDAFVALGIACTAALARAGQRRAGGVLAGSLIVLKATGVAFACGYVLEYLRIRGREMRRDRDRPGPIMATAAGFAVAAAFALPPLAVALGVVRAGGRYAPSLSAQGLLGPWLALALAAAALACAWRAIALGEARAYAWFGIAAILALPNVYPWYGLWLAPCALAAGPGPAAVALWMATFTAVARYLPDAAGTLPWNATLLGAAIALLPLLVALAEFAPSRRLEKEIVRP